MTERYFCIDPEEAARLLKAVHAMRFQKRGGDRRAYLIDQYAVLSANRMKLRNVVTRDDDLAYLDELIETLIYGLSDERPDGEWRSSCIKKLLSDGAGMKGIISSAS